MFCSECGAELDEGDLFCTECGARVEAETGPESLPASAKGGDAITPAPNESNGAGSNDVGTGEGTGYKASPAGNSTNAGATPSPSAPNVDLKGSRGVTRRTAAVIVALAILIAGGGTFAFLALRDGMNPGSETTSASRRLAVPITIEAPGYDSAATRIPLHVTGTDINGTAVDEVAYVGADGTGLELAAGSYDVTVAASPLLADGTIYEVPEAVVHVDVARDGSTANVGGADDGMARLTFVVADPATVTDEQLADARRYAEADPDDDGRAAELADKAEANRTEATGGATTERERIAVAFARTYYTNAEVKEEVGQNDEGAVVYETAAIESWLDACLDYVAPDSDLYTNFQIQDYVEGLELVRSGSVDRLWGVIEAWTICRNVEVIDSSEDNVTVHVTYSGGNGGYSDDAAVISEDMTITFDPDNKIVSLSTANFS